MLLCTSFCSSSLLTFFDDIFRLENLKPKGKLIMKNPFSKVNLVLALLFSAQLTAETQGPATQNATTKVLAFAGSTRKDSYNKKLVQEAAAIARKSGASVTVIDLKEYPIPLYDGDAEAAEGMPANAKRLRDLMIASDDIIIASPEYNGSVSAVLKNALDWVSRSEDGSPSRSAFKGKKFAIMSTSPGMGGGARGLVHLTDIIEGIGGIVIKKKVVVPDGYKAYDENGSLENSKVEQELQEEINELLQN
jgi:chromate reductase, NAD(P)H dehydrogenase (quinone)